MMNKVARGLVVVSLALVLLGAGWSARARATAENRLYLPISLDVPPPNLPLLNGSFEAGRTGWTEFSALGYDIISTAFPGSVAPHSGAWAAWLGGDDNETSSISQQVTVPATAPLLTYWRWIALADACGFDHFTLWVNGVLVDGHDLCHAADTNGWRPAAADLSDYAGQTVTLELRVTTDGSGNSNLFIDDLAFGAPQREAGASAMSADNTTSAAQLKNK